MYFAQTCFEITTTNRPTHKDNLTNRGSIYLPSSTCQIKLPNQNVTSCQQHIGLVAPPGIPWTLSISASAIIYIEPIQSCTTAKYAKGVKILCWEWMTFGNRSLESLLHPLGETYFSYSFFGAPCWSVLFACFAFFVVVLTDGFRLNSDSCPRDRCPIASSRCSAL